MKKGTIQMAIVMRVVNQKNKLPMRSSVMPEIWPEFRMLWMIMKMTTTKNCKLSFKEIIYTYTPELNHVYKLVSSITTIK